MSEVEKVRVYLEKNDISELWNVFTVLKEKFHSQRVLDSHEIFDRVGESIGRDFNAESFIPTSLQTKKLTALSSKMTGDCLYSSVSLSLFGDNSQCEILRILTCIELFLNASYYAEHPVISSTWENCKDKFSSYQTVFICCVSGNALPKELGEKDFSLVDVCKNEAIQSCKIGIWSSFLCIAALASVINKKIETFYPDKPFTKYSLIFNNAELLPRVNFPTSAPIYVLFLAFNAFIFEMHMR